MTSGLLRRTGSRPCSRPAGSLSVLFFWGCEGWWFAGRWCGIGAALDALWGELTSALWWMLWDVVLVVWGWRFLSKGFC